MSSSEQTGVRGACEAGAGSGGGVNNGGGIAGIVQEQGEPSVLRWVWAVGEDAHSLGRFQDDQREPINGVRVRVCVLGCGLVREAE